MCYNDQSQIYQYIKRRWHHTQNSLQLHIRTEKQYTSYQSSYSLVHFCLTSSWQLYNFDMQWCQPGSSGLNRSTLYLGTYQLSYFKKYIFFLCEISCAPFFCLHYTEKMWLLYEVHVMIMIIYYTIYFVAL